MGNTGSRQQKTGSDEPSNSEEFKKMKIENVIDYIATKYMTKASFQDLRNLNKKEYCDKLVILTSKVIKHHLNDIEISYMDQRTKGGVEVNKLDKKKVLYLAKNDFDRLDITSSIRKKRMCIGVAKFYIKIAHLFAAIAMAINPIYTYTDSTGIERSVSLMEKKNIPSNLKIRYAKNSLCSRRIKALMTKQNTENGIIVKPENCSMNIKEQSIIDGIDVPVITTGTKNLDDESGIPELELLYYDEYDFNEGKYYGMSDKATKEYEADVAKFYKMFTGNKSVPKKIKKFSDIPLKDFHNQKLCTEKNSLWLKSYKGKTTDKLFKHYADHLKEMMVKSQRQEKSLLTVISKLFSYWIDPVKQEKQLTINPKINESSLQVLIIETRKILIGLYITCESDFQKGLEIFEAIIKSKMLQTAKRKISSFDNMSDDLMVEEENKEQQDMSGAMERLDVMDHENKQEVGTLENKIPALEQMPLEEMPLQQMPPQEMPQQEMPQQEMPQQEMPPQEMPPQEMPSQEMPQQEMPPEEDGIL